MSLFSIFRKGAEPPSDSPQDRELTIVELSIGVKYEAGQVRESIAESSAAIKRYPRHAPFYFMRANAREDVGDWGGAISDYDEYLRLLPNQHNALFRKGLCYQQSGRAEQALQCYDQAVQHYGEIKTPLSQIASEIAEAQGKRPKRRNWFTISKEQILNNRAVLRSQAGNMQGAYEDTSEAIGLDPNYVNAYRVRGVVLIQTGNMDQGKRDIRKAASLGDAQSAALLAQLGG